MKNSSFNIGICLYNLNKYKLAIKVFEEYQKSFGINFEPRDIFPFPAFLSMN